MKIVFRNTSTLDFWFFTSFYSIANTFGVFGFFFWCSPSFCQPMWMKCLMNASGRISIHHFWIANRKKLGCLLITEKRFTMNSTPIWAWKHKMNGKTHLKWNVKSATKPWEKFIHVDDEGTDERKTLQKHSIGITKKMFAFELCILIMIRG